MPTSAPQPRAHARSAPGVAISTGTGRRERKKLQTREALRTSALRLFAEKGFDQTTVEDITSDADLAPRTFFLHFASKDDVLLGDAQHSAEVFRDRLADQPEELSALEAIRRTVVALVSEPGMSRAEMMLRTRLMEQAPSLMAKNLEQYTHFEALIAQDVARRCHQDVRRDIAPNLISACAMTALRVALQVWCRRGGIDDLADHVEESFDLLTAGFEPGQPPGPPQPSDSARSASV